MRKNPLKEAAKLGQSIWLDNIRRGLIMQGSLLRLINEDGVSGITSNPSIFEKAILSGNDYDQVLKRLSRQDISTEELFETLAVEDIQRAADVFRDVFNKSKGADGYVSLEVSPSIAYDCAKTVKEAARLFNRVGRPNVMIKIPATKAGVKAIRLALEKGINVNATLLFSVERYVEVARACISALENRLKAGLPVDKLASVASFFVSRIDTSVDRALENLSAKSRDKKHRKIIIALQGRAAVSNCKLAYRQYLKLFSSKRFKALAKNGARAQRLLWASTSTKNPAYSDTLYVDELIGKNTINTLPESTLDAFRDHGRPKIKVSLGAAAAIKHMKHLQKAGVRISVVTKALEKDGVLKFADAYKSILKNLSSKRERILKSETFQQTTTPDYPDTQAEKCMAELEFMQFPKRLWARDPNLWKREPEHQKIIRNSLGWLDSAEKMTAKLSELQDFTDDVRKAGFTHAVVLGMGGSSLAPEVMRSIFGHKADCPKLLVLDSTDPARVMKVQSSIDPDRTLFIISSKSGGTIEPNCFFKHFWSLVKKGGSFAAITDPGSSLEKLAKENHFRKVFLNPSDIGGRFSALSWFGLVPAAVSGVNVKAILARAMQMMQLSGADVPAAGNPGLQLGSALAGMGMTERNKITLVMPKRIESFGLWIEQLLAESTGKEGKGLVPIAGEELGEPSQYSKDRVFVHTGLESFPDENINAGLVRLEEAGHPVIRITMRDLNDLGAEFLRWETATAAVGALFGINPFDQPNVQESKSRTMEMLKEIHEKGTIREPDVIVHTTSFDTFYSGAVLEQLPGKIPNPDTFFPDFVSLINPGDYTGILAYLPSTEETDRSLNALRAKIRAHTSSATLFSYGPRYLHSTGQLHKGGPNNGVFLMLTADPDEDLPVPGEHFSFWQLEMAQALGDFQALDAAGRRVVRIHLKKPQRKSIKAFADVF